MISFCLRNLNVYSSVTQKLFTKNFWVFLKCTIAGLSINILCAGDKLPMQRGFSKNGRGDLLPTLRFLGRLYNFCNFVTERWTLVRQHPVKSLVFFNVMSWWHVEEQHILQIWKWSNTTKKRVAEIASLRKLKST